MYFQIFSNFLFFLLKIFIRFLIVVLIFYLNVIFIISNINEELTLFIIWKEFYLIFNNLSGYSLYLFNIFITSPLLNKIKMSFLIQEYSNILLDYYTILYFIIVCGLISLVLFSVSYFFFFKPVKYNEKLLPYECGFDPFNDARKEFDVNFYLVAIFFIIFDIEAVFIFPWVVSFYQLTNLGFFNMIDFIIELLIGYFYLIFVDALDWY